LFAKSLPLSYPFTVDFKRALYSIVLREHKVRICFGLTFLSELFNERPY